MKRTRQPKDFTKKSRSFDMPREKSATWYVWDFSMDVRNTVQPFPSYYGPTRENMNSFKGFCSSIPPKTWPWPSLTIHACEVESPKWSQLFLQEDVMQASRTPMAKKIWLIILRRPWNIASSALSWPFWKDKSKEWLIFSLALSPRRMSRLTRPLKNSCMSICTICQSMGTSF